MGVLINLEGTKVEDLFTWVLGKLTNNQVEWYALYKSMDWVIERTIKKILLISNSVIVIKQIRSSKIKQETKSNNLHQSETSLLSLINETHIFHTNRINNVLDNEKANEGIKLGLGVCVRKVGKSFKCWLP